MKPLLNLRTIQRYSSRQLLAASRQPSHFCLRKYIEFARKYIEPKAYRVRSTYRHTQCAIHGESQFIFSRQLLAASRQQCTKGAIHVLAQFMHSNSRTKFNSWRKPIHFQPPAASRQLPAASCQPPAVSRQPPAASRQPPAFTFSRA